MSSKRKKQELGQSYWLQTSLLLTYCLLYLLAAITFGQRFIRQTHCFVAFTNQARIPTDKQEIEQNLVSSCA
jgi:hypothetical protein